MEPEDSAGDGVQFAVSVSKDRDEFFRLTCPSCGRDFKIQIDPSELQWALGGYCQRIGHGIGPQAPDRPHSNRIRCPYCGNEDEVVHMHTEETMAYIKRIINREVVIPLLNRWASGLEETTGRGRRSGGLFSISVEFKHSRPFLPVRPIHGPEPADLKIVTFLCCGKKVKISKVWTNVQACPFCAAEVALM